MKLNVDEKEGYIGSDHWCSQEEGTGQYRT